MADRRIRAVKTLGGAGKVYSSRGTSLLPPSGETIRPLIMVEHIPVMRNQPGVEDFEDLARILREQGLSLQAATDSDGNVMLYNALNKLCWHAKGANSLSCGVEHMHLSTGERWTKKQLRASAWLWAYAFREYGIPMRVAQLGSGNGEVRVLKRGHTSHRMVSIKAGFNDRTDPGSGYDWEYVRHAALYFRDKGHFVGA